MMISAIETTPLKRGLHWLLTIEHWWLCFFINIAVNDIRWLGCKGAVTPLQLRCMGMCLTDKVANCCHLQRHNRCWTSCAFYQIRAIPFSSVFPFSPVNGFDHNLCLTLGMSDLSTLMFGLHSWVNSTYTQSVDTSFILSRI